MRVARSMRSSASSVTRTTVLGFRSASKQEFDSELNLTRRPEVAPDCSGRRDDAERGAVHGVNWLSEIRVIEDVESTAQDSGSVRALADLRRN